MDSPMAITWIVSLSLTVLLCMLTGIMATLDVAPKRAGILYGILCLVAAVSLITFVFSSVHMYGFSHGHHNRCPDTEMSNPERHENVVPFTVTVREEDPTPDIPEEPEPSSVDDSVVEIDTYDMPTSGLNKVSGVNYFADRTETYYSSRVKRHRDTDDWTPDSQGVYRDVDGYVVVASVDFDYGEIIDTSFGPAKVYDDGCDPGITDIYVDW